MRLRRPGGVIERLDLAVGVIVVLAALLDNLVAVEVVAMLDLEEAVHHYRDILGMVETGRDAQGRVYLKCWDERYVLIEDEEGNEIPPPPPDPEIWHLTIGRPG